MNTTMRKSRPRSQRHRVRRGVQRQILSGELRSGDRLRQVELAQRYGVAQTVIRESLLELQYSGLVYSVENMGMFVNELDPGTLISAYEIREMFEGLAARLCCEQASRQNMRELRELAEQIHAHAAKGEITESGRLDREFHQRTIHISNNAMLTQLTEGYRALGMIVRAERDIDEVKSEHLAIVDAIEQGDGQLAERHARDHVRRARQALQQQVDEGNFEPAWITDEDQESSASANSPNRQPAREEPNA